MGAVRRTVNAILTATIMFLLACSDKKARQTGDNLVLNDTFFFNREEKNGELIHALFIDSTGNSKHYEAAFKRTDIDQNIINYFLSQLKGRAKPLKKVDLLGLPAQWRSVHQYKGKYYLYQPSEDGSRRNKQLTDTLLMFYSMEGYIPAIIRSVNMLTPNLYDIVVTDTEANNDYLPKELKIYVIDPVTNLSVWEMMYNKRVEFELMVPKEHMRQYPIIVNSSRSRRSDEFKFDKIDFGQLLKGKR